MKSPETVAVMWRRTPADDEPIRRVVGAGSLVEDSRDAVDPDVVLLRPSSPLTLRGIRRRFPRAEIVMLDSDWATAALLPPAMVDRAFAAGADRYVVALEGLPPMIYWPPTPRRAAEPSPEPEHAAVPAAA